MEIQLDGIYFVEIQGKIRTQKENVMKKKLFELPERTWDTFFVRLDILQRRIKGF